MSPEQWRQVENLYHAARAQSEDGRMRMLAAAEPEVRREVESLLDQPRGGPLSRPAQEWPGAASTANFAAPPSTVAHYRITEKIGEGGMGAVYRATDTKLGREVAIKFLLPSLAGDSEYMARFQREAKVLASLNHPNIAVVHGLEESNGAQALVMELVEGPTLAARIAQGAIPLKEALPIAEQIAEALEAAHEKGVVHRDLKPGNVKVKPDGAVKVLDFGLAKACATPSAPCEDSSTLTMGMSEAGKILGTAPYMSPEQASGKPVDKRSDIWAFGVVLWEMLTGKRLFSGDTMPDTLAQVLTARINLDQLPKQTPSAIRNLVCRCLERDARNRLRDIGEARIALRTCLVDANSGAESPVQAKSLPHKSGWIVAGAVALLAVIAGWALWPKPAPPVHVMRLEIPPPEGVLSVIHVPLSPDGRKLLVSTLGVTGMWVRDLDALEWRHLPDTSGAQAPFWSPDSKFVAFGVGNQLKKIDISGGPPQILCTVQNTVASGSWNRDGKIVFGSMGKGPLYMVSAAGGTPAEVTAIDSERGETFHTSLSLLPDGKRFLYFRQGPAGVSGVYSGSIGAKPGEQSQERILSSRFGAAYADGYLFFMRGDALMAQSFDSGRLELTGEAVLVAGYVDTQNVHGIFSVSPSGILAYQGSRPAPRHFQFTWFDRQGNREDAFGEPISGWGLTMSPDGGRAAFRDSDSLHPGDLWNIDFARGTRTRLTFRQGFSRPGVWSSDGTRVIFTAETGGSVNPDAFYEKASSGAGDEKELFKQAGQNMVPTSWSHDGRYLLYHTTATTPTDDVWVLPLEGDRKPIPLLAEKFNERVGSFSPDGRWIAYKSDETGRWEIYVRPFVAAGPSGVPSVGGGKWQISRDGAAHDGLDTRVGFPRWRADGKEILFGGPNGAVMSVEVDTNGGNFQPGVAKRLFTLPPGAGGWDVTPDGKKFLAPVAQTAQASPTPITVVLNWRAGLNP